jgi:hypothetical protein
MNWRAGQIMRIQQLLIAIERESNHAHQLDDKRLFNDDDDDDDDDALMMRS